MSYPELLEAIRQLPRPEKIRLMHDLVDDVADPAVSDGIPEHLRPFVPPEGAVVPLHSPVSTDAAGMQLLESLRGKVGDRS